MVEKSHRPLETTQQMVPKSISYLTKENWVKSLWEEVCKANETTKNKGKAPIAKVDLDKRQAHVDMVKTGSPRMQKPNPILQIEAKRQV